MLGIQSLVGCSPGQPAAEAPRADAPARSSATPAAAPTATPAPRALVVAFGDSLYAGYGVLAQESFPVELQKALGTFGIAADVRNAGVSGDTTAAGRARLAYALDGLDRKPDLVLVGLGGNDMLRGIDPAQTRANLTAICAELERRGIPIFLTGMIAAPNLGPDYARAFNAIYPDLAKRFGAGLYPFFLDGVVFDRTMMLPDRVHPNPRGIDAITAKVAPLVAERLRATAPTAAAR